MIIAINVVRIRGFDSVYAIVKKSIGRNNLHTKKVGDAKQ